MIHRAAAPRFEFFDSRTPLGWGLWRGFTSSVGRAIRGLKPRGFEKPFASAVLLVGVIGCQSAPPPPQPTTRAVQLAIASGLTSPIVDDVLKSIVAPPIGWKADPLKQTDKHRHRVWLSPTGDTAYGIIYFDLPLPVGLNLALNGFLSQMKQTEGEANLLSRQDDDSIPGLRFVAEGGPYTIRCKFQVDGWHGWAVYAGTLRSRPVNEKELKAAELAREQTRVDLP
jgi:hypothetical protein